MTSSHWQHSTQNRQVPVCDSGAKREASIGALRLNNAKESEVTLSSNDQNANKSKTRTKSQNQQK
jgi:hypothetical protein